MDSQILNQRFIMKKHIIKLAIFFFFITIQCIQAQEENKAKQIVGYSLKLGKRIRLNLIPDTDSLNYKLDPITCTEFKDTLILSKAGKTFSEDLKQNEIEIISAIGYYLDPKNKTTNNPPQSILIIKNNTSHTLKYKAKICVCGKDTFIETSVVPVYKGIFSIEMWPYCIEKIMLYEFTKLND